MNLAVPDTVLKLRKIKMLLYYKVYGPIFQKPFINEEFEKNKRNIGLGRNYEMLSDFNHAKGRLNLLIGKPLSPWFPIYL